MWTTTYGPERDFLVRVGDRWVRRSAVWEVSEPYRLSDSGVLPVGCDHDPWRVSVLVDKRYEGRSGEIDLSFPTEEKALEFVRQLTAVA